MTRSIGPKARDEMEDCGCDACIAVVACTDLMNGLDMSFQHRVEALCSLFGSPFVGLAAQDVERAMGLLREAVAVIEEAMVEAALLTTTEGEA